MMLVEESGNLRSPVVCFAKGETVELGEKIDYIFITPNLKTLDAEIIRTNDNGRYPTDHYPIRATVEFAN